uniref:Transmembrane protein n=1 Tax=Noccaea caerulescens TaxID=107243 RepID=A0A1J3I108_NOCCA
MAIIGDALRQAFMPKQEYESLREEDRAWIKLQRPTLMSIVAFLCFVIFTCTIVSLKIVFPSNVLERPFCSDWKLQPLPIYGKARDSDLFPGAFYLTDQETVDFYWMVVFVPSTLIFLVSSVYLVAGIFVAYSAPHRHGLLKVVDNNYCASRKGGVRCLSILNVVFAIIYGLLAIFLGSSLLTLGSSCSVPLFWCYEISSWGLVILYAGTAFFLRRSAALTLDEGEFGNRNHQGLEMLEANPFEFTPDVERRVNEGFKAWIGPSSLSSDEEEDEFYSEVPNVTHTVSSRQRS